MTKQWRRDRLSPSHGSPSSNNHAGDREAEAILMRMGIGPACETDSVNHSTVLTVLFEISLYHLDRAPIFEAQSSVLAYRNA